MYALIVATVSFAAASYRVLEGAGTLSVTIIRSGNTGSLATVLVATDNFHGTASGEFFYSCTHHAWVTSGLS